MSDVPAPWLRQLNAETEPAILLSPQYEVLATNKAYRARFGANAVGRRCHEVSHHYASPCENHGESCPLAACLSTRQPARVLHVHQTPRGPEHVDVKLHPIQDASGEIRAFLEVMRKVSTGSTTPGGPELMGTSRPFNDAIGLLQRAAPSEVPVLLLGESGTGKELAAKALHQSSPRATKSFVPVACSGLTDALFESELFGHERGSFTGAHQRHIGLVESAQGGTLFLDEIGDVPLGMQVKLLRLLESRQFRRVGGTEPIRADFRLVCATHRPLEAMVEEGSFRHDLFYRINAFPVHLPSLRERTDDIELLATHFLPHHLRLDPQALQALEQHDYPGNIRELKNMLERAQILADGDWIRIEHLPASLRHRPPSAPPSATFDRVRPLHEAERSYLRWALEAHGGDRASLAEKLGISERTLYRKLASIDEV